MNMTKSQTALPVSSERTRTNMKDAPSPSPFRVTRGQVLGVREGVEGESLLTNP